MDKFKDMLSDFLPTLGVAALVLTGGIALTILISILAKKAFSKTKIDPSLASFFVRLIRILCYIIILITVLSRLGISTTGLIAFFSAALAAVALALKDSIADVASGIILLFTRPVVTGDFIEFGAYKGTVQKIDLIHTKILTYDDTNVIVPNSKITTSEINNYTEHPVMRVVVKVPVHYTASIDDTKRVLMDTVCATPLILAGEVHIPQVRLEQFGESSLDYTVRCWCDFKDYWTVYYALTESIKKALDTNKIPIPYNQLDVHIIEK